MSKSRPMTRGPAAGHIARCGRAAGARRADRRRGGRPQGDELPSSQSRPSLRAATSTRRFGEPTSRRGETPARRHGPRAEKRRYGRLWAFGGRAGHPAGTWYWRFASLTRASGGTPHFALGGGAALDPPRFLPQQVRPMTYVIRASVHSTRPASTTCFAISYRGQIVTRSVFGLSNAAAGV